MKRLAILLGVFFISAGCAHMPSSSTRELSGNWTGSYSYANADQKMTAVEFKTKLIQKGDVISGSMTEPNTFDALQPPPPDPNFISVPQLSATLSAGKISGDQITFTKTYNGEGGYSHSVHYKGTWNSQQQIITGMWTIREVIGPFTMQKDR